MWHGEKIDNRSVLVYPFLRTLITDSVNRMAPTSSTFTGVRYDLLLDRPLDLFRHVPRLAFSLSFPMNRQSSRGLSLQTFRFLPST